LIYIKNIYYLATDGSARPLAPLEVTLILWNKYFSLSAYRHLFSIYFSFLC